ncbi:MAG: CPBP family intramembrane metalloprotease [Candidatus Dormibacteraeota bacterium]|nr:CPBP family intramembrane metalloprotease [Candidatus Dormibacteraeota bacterium]
MIGARAAGLDRAPVLVAAVGGATLARLVIGGTAPAASVPAALVFSAALLAAAALCGARPARFPWTGVALGVAGAAALVAISLVGVPAVTLGARAQQATLAWWVPLVTVVAAAEELVFRGALFDAVRVRSGDVVAIAVTALLFAAIHLPLYGAAALPVDLCVGVFLGCLRVGSGGITAPLIAHVLADVATGWVG